MEKQSLLIALVALTLALSAINLYSTYNFQSRYELQEKYIEDKKNQVALQAEKDTTLSLYDNPQKGSDDAPITIVEFSDFQCPYCARFYAQTLPYIDNDYIQTGKVKFVYMDFPLSFHQNAQKAAEAGECADEQGKFLEYHNKIFENQQALDAASLKRYAKDLGLDAEKFNECLDSGRMAEEVEKDMSEGMQLGVTGTPAFFVNGNMLVGAHPYEAFVQLIEQELAKAKT